MIKVQPQEYETYYQWIVNTKTRWCSFLVQRHFYDVGVNRMQESTMKGEMK